MIKKITCLDGIGIFTMSKLSEFWATFPDIWHLKIWLWNWTGHPVNSLFESVEKSDLDPGVQNLQLPAPDMSGQSVLQKSNPFASCAVKMWLKMLGINRSSRSLKDPGRVPTGPPGNRTCEIILVFGFLATFSPKSESRLLNLLIFTSIHRSAFRSVPNENPPASVVANSFYRKRRHQNCVTNAHTWVSL